MDAIDVTTTVRQLTETLQREANVRAVFGDPISLGTRSIVPVGILRIALGGGGGSGAGPKQDGLDAGHGGAGAVGFGLDVVPIGFIYEKDGDVVFTRIEPTAEGGLHKLLEVLRLR